MNIQEFAQGIRDFDPSEYGGDAWADDHKLAHHWITNINSDDAQYLDQMPNVYSDGESQFDEFKYTSQTRPPEAGGLVGGNLKDLWFNFKSGLLSTPTVVANQINTLINPYERYRSITDQINKLENILANPENHPTEWFPGQFVQRSEYSLEQTRKKLEHLHSFKSILEDVIERDRSGEPFTGVQLQKQIEGLDDSEVYKNRLTHFMTTSVQELLFQAYKGGEDHTGTLDATIALREHYNDKIDEWVQNDTRLQASLKWQQDVPFDSWEDFKSISMVSRGFTQLAGSMATMWAGGMVAKVPQAIGTAGKMNKIKTILDGMGGAGGVGMMVLMEGGEAQEEIIKYLVHEYEYTDPSGKLRKGIPIEDALPIAAYTATMVGVTNAMLEKVQLSKFNALLGAGKSSRRTLVKTITDSAMKKYFPKGLVGGKGVAYGITSRVADIGADAWEQGMIEGYQAVMTHVSTQAAINGYDVNSSVGFAQLMHDAGVTANEIGINNLAYPYTSKIDDVRVSAYTGSGGFLGMGGPSAAVSIPFNIQKWHTGPEDAQVLNQVVEEVKSGNQVKFDRKDNIIRIERDGKPYFIQADNASEAQHIENQLLAETEHGSQSNSLEFSTNVESGIDYLNLLVNQATPGPKQSNADIVRDGKIPSTGNAVQRLLLKHATSNNGKEATLGQKLADLLQAKDSSGNSIFSLAQLRQEKELAVQNKDHARARSISVLESAAVKIIKDKTADSIKKKIITDKDASIVERQVDEAVKNTVNIPNSKAIEKYINTIEDTNELEMEIGKALLDDNKIEVSFGESLDNKIQEWVEGKLNISDAIDNRINAEIEKKTEDAIDNLQAKDNINQIESQLQHHPVSNVNDPNANVDSLHALLKKEFMSQVGTGINPIQAVTSFLNGEAGNTKMYSTNLGRLLKRLKIDYNPQDLGNNKSRAKYISQIANSIQQELMPEYKKPSKKPIVKTRAEKQIEKETKEKKLKDSNRNKFKSGLISLYNQRANAKDSKQIQSIDDKILNLVDVAVSNKVISQKEADQAIDSLEKKSKEVQDKIVKEDVIEDAKPIEESKFETAAEDIGMDAADLKALVGEATSDLKKDLSKQASKETSKKTADRIDNDLKC